MKSTKIISFLLVFIFLFSISFSVGAVEAPSDNHNHSEECDHAPVQPPSDEPQINDEPSAGTESPSDEQLEEPESGEETEPIAPPNDTPDSAKLQATYDDYFSIDRAPDTECSSSQYTYKYDSTGVFHVVERSNPDRILFTFKDASFSNWFFSDNFFFYLDVDNALKKVNLSTMEESVLYQGKSLSVFNYTSNEIVYFVDAGSVIMLHIPTAISVTVFQSDRQMGLTVLNNNTILLYVTNDQLLADGSGDYGSDCFLLDISTTEAMPISMEKAMDLTIQTSSNNTIEPEIAQSRAILTGIQPPAYTVPLETLSTFNSSSSHSHGIFWTTTGQMCDPHSSDPDYPPETRPTCKWYNGGTQCYGFANYVYDLYHHSGSYRGASEKRNYYQPLTESTVYSILQTIPIGSDMRVRNSGHNVILAGYDASYVYLYHCNWGNDHQCEVLYWKLTHAEFASIMICINYYWHPSNHTHSWSWTTDANYHWQKCSGCPDIQNRSAHSWSWTSDSSQHWQMCSGCTFTRNSAAHTQGSITDNGDGTHSARCTVCQRFLVLNVPHFSNSYSPYDGSRHRAYCICGASLLLYEHIWNYSNLTIEHSKTCTRCGYSVREGHITTLTTTTSHHTYDCTRCSYVATNPHSWTYASGGSSGHVKRCTICGYTITNLLHTNSHTQYSATQHKRTCSLCGYVDYANHTWGSTYYLYGDQHYRQCTLCSYRQYSSHSKVYGSWVAVSTSATCRRRPITCSYCAYSSTEWDYAHRYPLFSKQCGDCNYRKP